jgi:signal peptidase I
LRLKLRGESSLLRLAVSVAVAVGAALLVQAFLVKPYRIPSESMEPTLVVGERVLVSRINYKFSDPDRGDIVVFHPPKNYERGMCGVHKSNDEACPRAVAERDSVNFVKRIVAVGGDRLSVRFGHSVVNGIVQKENFVRECRSDKPPCSFLRPVRIPPRHFFMMGDNRGSSDDSRFWGAIPEKWIIGQAFFTYWPPNRIG